MSQRTFEQSSRIPGSTASKKVRMTMACERCRSKKVKCDFAHPSCSRCQQAKAKCSYDGSATQVDLFNLVKLNETVDMLQQRVQSIESDLKDVSTNTQFVADEFRMTRSSNERQMIDPTTVVEEPQQKAATNFAAMNSLFASSSSSNGQWSLSLTPRGLRIDTNIISLHDLYDILLTGVSRIDLNANNESNNQSKESDCSSTSSTSTNTVPEIDRTTITRKNNLWKTKLKTFPLYSTWESGDHHDCKHHVKKKKELPKEGDAPEMISQETYEALMDIYSECLLCLPCADPGDSVNDRYKKGTLDPFLMNAALAWTARHAAIYHDLFPGQDPNVVGEQFFEKAQQLLKDRFTTTDIDTMHGLILLYIYCIGRPGERRHSKHSESYIYLGLAIRMCLNMKMYQESTSPDPIMREKHRRFFWAIYFLETLGTIHSDKAFSLPSEDLITVCFPTVLPHEQGEKHWRVLFTSQRFRITRIYRNIIYKTSHEQPLLSSVSTLDKELQAWVDQLPEAFKYSPDDINRDWTTTSFREQGCLKLNSEYNFQLCQLYSLFFTTKKSGLQDNISSSQQPSAIELLTKERCRRAADNIVELLALFSRLNQRWCHFSLETTMVASMVYSSMLQSPDANSIGWAKQQLERMLHLLSNSPVRNHKYVFALTKRIEKLLAEQPTDDDDVDLDLDEDEQQHQQQAMDTTPVNSVVVEPISSNINNEQLSSSPNSQTILQQSSAQPSPQLVQQQEEIIQQKVDMLDMPSGIFDLTKETTVNPLQFLYAPSVMGLCTTTQPHDSMMATPQPATAAPHHATTAHHSGFTHHTHNYSSATPSPINNNNTIPYYPSTTATTTTASPSYHMPLHPHHPLHPQHHQHQHHWHHPAPSNTAPFNDFNATTTDHAPPLPLPTQFVNMEGLPLQQPQQNNKKRSNTDNFGYYR